MKVIISPAKRMRGDIDFMEPSRLPVFVEKAEYLLPFLKAMSLEELKKLLGCNHGIASLAYSRYQSMDLRHNTVPALLSFDGIQYQYMAPQVFTYENFDYVQGHLYILSGLYGILRPMDGVVPYRLELDAKLQTPVSENLYQYWGDSVYRELTRRDNVILNLASKQYSRIVKKYLSPKDRFITCVFGETREGKIREKGVYVKMARGEMVRFMAENRVEKPEELKAFDRLGFSYHPECSDENTYVFLMDKNKMKIGNH